ncbi:LysR family transcriptional regulator [Thalassotalea insulae]|uniref:LysR family transcriptional regulator n=1 Tax=Thalassotalea insulae TaxID=2056778 RepID=A0ABQ6GS73_9GAMM|nr:LysR family transcriptional regulator [Thalassotalea insulae]GLX78810.1 LysR family transcriptional regulator [Thalassotalea insulae]
MDISKSQLSISHLKMICALERCETVKEAAQELFITQPALTNRIREAERRLNSQLFIRRGRKIIMSNAGKRLLYSAQKILQELARAEHDIGRLTDGIEQVLRVGLPHYASFQWLPEVMKGFHQHYAHIEIEISAQAAKQPLNALINHEVDIAMISTAEHQLQLDDKQFGSICLVEDELVACLAKEHPKAQQGYLTAEDFAGETYVTNSTVPEKDREYELLFKPQGVLPKKVLQVGFNDAIIELVKANLGISIFSKRQIHRYLDSSQQEIKIIPLTEQGLTVFWHLVYLNHPLIAAPAQTFAKILQQQLIKLSK